MNAIRLTLAVIVPILCVHTFLGATASAQVRCGEPHPETGDPVKGAIVLNDKDSVVKREFGRDSDTQQLNLLLEVTGCDLASDATVEVLPLKDVDEVPQGVLPERRTVTPSGNELEVRYRIDADKFDPGTYGALIEVSEPDALTTFRTPVTVSRSENRPWIPLIPGVIAGAIGFIVFYWTKLISRYRIRVPKRWLLVAFVIACGAGAWAAITGWLDQGVWALDDNWRAAAAAAFPAATAGVMVALLKGVFTEEPDSEQRPPQPDPARQPEQPAPRA